MKKINTLPNTETSLAKDCLQRGKFLLTFTMPTCSINNSITWGTATPCYEIQSSLVIRKVNNQPGTLSPAHHILKKATSTLQR